MGRVDRGGALLALVFFERVDGNLCPPPGIFCSQCIKSDEKEVLVPLLEIIELLDEDIKVNGFRGVKVPLIFKGLF